MVLFIGNLRHGVHELHRFVKILELKRFDDLTAALRPAIEFGEVLFNLRGS
jgi:hypothetical protein